MTTIIGVDYSGAKHDRATWKTEAELHDSILNVTNCARIKRNDLTESLDSLKDPTTIVALDFPFSVPLDFAKELITDPSGMPDVWKAVASVEKYCTFDKLRRDFVKRHGEIMRKGDANFGGPFSPLKLVNPNMLPMTYYGILMLHHLWKSKKGFYVPPLPRDGRNGPTILETMPGVLLRSFGLPATSYKTKNKTNQGRPEDFRERILVGLQQRYAESLQINDGELKKCRDNPDCLDSLVAAIGAAEWANDESQFLLPRKSIPQNEEFDIAILEGWIYAPKR